MTFVLEVFFAGLCTLASYGGDYWLVIPNTQGQSQCYSNLPTHSPNLTVDLAHIDIKQQPCFDDSSLIEANIDLINHSSYYCHERAGQCIIADAQGNDPPSDDSMRAFGCEREGHACVLLDPNCRIDTSGCTIADPCVLPNIQCESKNVARGAEEECLFSNQNKVSRDTQGRLLAELPLRGHDLAVSFNGPTPSAAPAVHALRLARRADLFSTSSFPKALVKKELLTGTDLDVKLDSRLRLHDGILTGQAENRDKNGNLRFWCFDKANPVSCDISTPSALERSLHERALWEVGGLKGVVDISFNPGSSSPVRNLQLNPRGPGDRIRVGISNYPEDLEHTGVDGKVLYHFGWVYETSKEVPKPKCPVPTIRTGTIGSGGGGVFCPVDLASGG